MEVPDLVRGRLGDESVETAVSIGDEDTVCFTPSRTLVYRGEGLLSDESVDAYSHDAERLIVSEGRRKVRFRLDYVDGSEDFTVPASRAEAVLERLVSGILRTVGVIDSSESIAGVFRFSELTLVVTESRLVKHVGKPVWAEDYTEYPYDDVTGLSFEEGSVATSVVLSIDGRPDRIKAPSDEVPAVRKALERTLFEYHGVDSLAALNRTLGADSEDVDESDRDDGSEISFGSDISPLVGGDEPKGSALDDPEPTEAASVGSGADRTDAADTGTTSETGGSGGVDTPAGATAGTASGDNPGATKRATADIDPETIEEMQRQLENLTETVDEQQELLERQHRTIQQLIEELRRGR